MSTNAADLHDAEDFFRFFEVPYDPKIVVVKRIPILKMFRAFLSEAGIEDLAFSESEQKEEARKYLIKAYEEVISPSPASTDCAPSKTPSKCSSCGGGCG